MSLTTRPPGDAARPDATRPVATSGASRAGPLPAAPPAAAPTPAPSLGTAAPDGAAAVRVFVEEVRAAVEARLSAGARPELQPATDGDPGNAVAALLRWIRAATASSPLPRETLATIVADAHARAADAPARGGPDVRAPVREALANARDLVLRALVVLADPRPNAAVAPRSGPPLRGDAPSAAPAGARLPASEATALLRAFVDGIRAELSRTVGNARLPPAPLPLVADAHGAQLAPALLRWLTSAVAERGVPLAALREAVRAAYARAAAVPLAHAGGVPSDVSAAAVPDGLEPSARQALLAVRDAVLRGLGDAPERLDAAAARDAGAPRADARGDLVPVDPRGVPVPAGAAMLHDERVEEIGVGHRPRAERDDASVVRDEEPANAARAGAYDLQGPMDCIRRYFDAYVAGDSADYAAQWVYPACVWSGGRWTAYPNASACALGNDEYVQAARTAGIVGGRIVMLRVEPTSEDVALVHGVFTRERADGSVAAETEAAYTTVRTAAGWRVAVCVVKK